MMEGALKVFGEWKERREWGSERNEGRGFAEKQRKIVSPLRCGSKIRHFSLMSFGGPKLTLQQFQLSFDEKLIFSFKTSQIIEDVHN